MSADAPTVPTGAVVARDMIVVHGAFGREHRLAPGLVRGVAKRRPPRLLMPFLDPRDVARYAGRVHGTATR